MPILTSILSKLRMKYLIPLLVFLSIVLLIVIISVSGKCDDNTSNDKQVKENETKTFGGSKSINEDKSNIYYQVPKVDQRRNKIEVSTEHTEFLVKTQGQLTKVNKSPKTTTTTTLKTTLAVRLNIQHQTLNRINERQTAKKFDSAEEARKAYLSLHGRSISEAKCAEYEILHCRLKDDQLAKTVVIYDGPPKKGQVEGVAVGGRDTGFGEFPHMGALGWRDVRYKLTFKCGSSLISRNFLLTAAHCTWVSPRQFNLLDPKPYLVRLGNKNIDEINSKYYLDVKIQEIIVHPAYKSPLKYSDIALMRLDKDVVFDLYMLPACLWHNPVVEAGTQVIGTGWGYTDVAKKNMSAKLQAVDIKIIDSNECDENVKVGRNRNFKGVRSHQICAGVMEGGVDTCQGDSGGPIQVREARSCKTATPLSTVIGVTSFGFGCARPGMPSVYTRVSSYIDWIEENVWREELNL